MEVTIQGIDLSPLAKQLTDLKKPVREGAARGVSVLLVKHFREKNATPNKKGFPRSNFWSAAADSVALKPDDGTASAVAVSKEGVRLRWKGGDVHPKKGRALAIPAEGSVAGVWPSEYGGAGYKGGKATFLAWPKGRSFGFIAERKPKGSKDRTLHVLWWLKEVTHHKPDPTVIPDDDTMREAALKAARSVLRAEVHRAKTAGAPPA
jgi:hypothetical protein